MSFNEGKAMNRLKKEELKKHNEARAGLTPDEVAAVDRADEIKAKIENLAAKMHSEMFPEEYDFMGDSNADASDRSRGVNPMTLVYSTEVNCRRAQLGVSALNQAGLAVTNDSMKLCLRAAEKAVASDIDNKCPDR